MHMNGDGNRLDEIYENCEQEFETILSMAERAVSNDWEIQFIAGLREKFDEFGSNMFLSPKQKAILDRIVGQA